MMENEENYFHSSSSRDILTAGWLAGQHLFESAQSQSSLSRLLTAHAKSPVKNDRSIVGAFHRDFLMRVCFAFPHIHMDIDRTVELSFAPAVTFIRS